MEIDWTEPVYQNDPYARAVLHFISSLRQEYLTLAESLREAEWTAFKQLARTGAVQGILRFEVSHYGDIPEPLDLPIIDGIFYEEVSGDYPSAPDTVAFSNTATVTLEVAQARLTGRGQRWQEILQQCEQNQPANARAWVLSLAAAPREKWRKGVSRMVPPPAGFTGGYRVYRPGGPKVASFVQTVAQASIGDINVSCQPQIVIKPPAQAPPVVNITIPGATAGRERRAGITPDEEPKETDLLTLAAIAALHRYSDGGLGVAEHFPLGKITETVNVNRQKPYDEGTVSKSVKRLFGSHGEYKKACQENRLFRLLKAMLEVQPQFRHYREHRAQDD